MEEFIYDDNSQIKIIKLKNNLMKSSYHSYSSISYKDISDTIRQINNEEIGKIFENNIRELLQFKLNWIIGEIPRKFSYREILIEDEKKIVIPKKPITITFENDSYLFSLIENDTLEVKNLNGKEKINIPKDEDKTLTYHKVRKIYVLHSKYIEMDGSFSINNFTLNKFDKNEIVTLYNGMDIKDDISSYDYAILEVKLSENNIKEMIQQLKRDKTICETILNKRVLLIGFINTKRIETDISEEASGLNCLIFGLNNSHFFGKDVTKYIDWNLVKDISSLNKKYDDLNKKYDDLNTKIDDLNKKIDDLNKKIDLLISSNNQSQKEDVIKVKFLGKKRYLPEN